MLELEFIELSKSLGAGEIRWLAFFFKLDLFTERIFQSALDQIDREIGDVDPDPLSTEFLRGVNGCAASAERIKHHVSGIARRADNAFQ